MMAVLLMLLITLLFPSCSPDNTAETRDIYLVTVADDFYTSSGKLTSSTLKTVVSDQAALISQISTFSENVHIYAFTSQNGSRYYSTKPKFTPVDKSGTAVDAQAASFDHFNYASESAESTADWTMDTVLETVGTIPSSADDLIIFTYSGHGDENGGAFITNANHTPYKKTNRETIIDAFNSIKGHKVFFLDSCYSSSFISSSSLVTKDSFSGNEDTYTGEDILTAVTKSSLKATADTQKDFWIMASAGRNQRANDSKADGTDSGVQKHYGEFTYYLLKALGYDMDRNQSEKKSSLLTFYSIYDYVRENFPSEDIASQTPRSSLKRLDIRIR